MEYQTQRAKNWERLFVIIIPLLWIVNSLLSITEMNESVIAVFLSKVKRKAKSITTWNTKHKVPRIFFFFLF